MDINVLQTPIRAKRLCLYLGSNRFPTPVIWLILTRQTSAGKGDQYELCTLSSSSSPPTDVGEIMLPALSSGGISSSLLSVGEAWLLALDRCRFGMSPSTRLWKCTSGSTCLRMRMMEDDVQWTSQMPCIQSPVPCIFTSQLFSTDLSLVLLIHSLLSFPHSLSESVMEDIQHNKMQVGSRWPSDQITLTSGEVITMESQDNPQEKTWVGWQGSASEERSAGPCPPSQPNQSLSSHMKTKVLDCVNCHRCHQILQGIDKWPPVSSRECTLACQEMIKDNTWLFCFLLPVRSNGVQSFLLKHRLVPVCFWRAVFVKLTSERTLLTRGKRAPCILY